MPITPIKFATRRNVPPSNSKGEVATLGDARLIDTGDQNSASAGTSSPSGVGDLNFLSGGSAMGARIRDMDWTKVALGPAENWPQALRTVISLMLSSKLPMYVAWGPDLTLLYNDGYAAILGSKHPAALGLSIAEVWAEVWTDLKLIIDAALEGHASFSKEVSRTLNRNGSEELAYFTYATSPVFDDAYRIVGAFCACRETTQDVDEREASILEIERLRVLFSQAPSFMAVLSGPNHVFEIANAAYLKIVGKRHLLGRPIREALPELEGQGFFEALDRTYATGEVLIGKRALLKMPTRARDVIDEQIFLDFIYQPVRDASGKITGIFVEGSDVTEATLADARRAASERFARATIDALTEHIAVVDVNGLIFTVNKAWREFGLANGADPSTYLEGANYLDVCDRAMHSGVEDAGQVAEMIREVAQGSRDVADLEYACHAPEQERWFSVRITRFSGAGPVFLVVSHEDITARRSSDRRIEFLATHDALTNLPNRRLLTERARQTIDRANTIGLELALFFVDIDNFKRLNDAYGHAIGDATLQAIAKELRSRLRHGDTLARIGGDEFVVVLTSLTNASLEAARFAQGVTERLSRPLRLDDREVSVTASIGISLFPTDGATIEDLLTSANTAMYAAKNGGRNAFRFFSPEMGAKAHERLELEAHLRSAMELGQFELFYQPQIHIRTGAMVGMEALIRWRHPQLGMIPPNKFISVAEETGLILPIGEWVLRTACEQCKRWQEAGLARLPVAVNISPVQLRQQEFVDLVARILEETGLSAGCLELEITETMVMSQTESMVGRLKELKGLGVLLTIDDFGTGYSNLGYLKSFPLDRLKVDQSFVHDLPADPFAGSIVRAIVAMGHSLGLQVIAEGVETAEQGKFLESIDCEEAQGYFYSFPLDRDDFEHMLRKNGLLRQAFA